MKIDWLNIIGILGTVASVIGLLYAFVVARRGERRKLLAYDSTPALPLASVLPDRTEHRLSIVYEREGAEPVNVKGAFLRFIQVGNLGREPVKREDIAPSDPLKLVVRGAKVLDIANAGVSRNVINFSISSFEETEKGVATSLLSFDFLDYQDGAVIRVLTDSRWADVKIVGTIIGMPEGIHLKDDLNKNPVLTGIGCTLAVLLQLAAIAGALYFFRVVTGGWSLLWLFLPPIAALILPGLISALVASYIWPKGPQWPKTLILPDWFVSRYMNNPEYHDYQIREEMLERRMLRELRKEHLDNPPDGA